MGDIPWVSEDTLPGAAAEPEDCSGISFSGNEPTCENYVGSLRDGRKVENKEACEKLYMIFICGFGQMFSWKQPGMSGRYDCDLDTDKLCVLSWRSLASQNENASSSAGD